MAAAARGLFASVCICAVAAPSAWAQTSASDQAEPPEGSGLGDIIVTARKRAETLQSVPVIASALDQTMIERFQTRDLADITTKVVGLQLGESTHTVGSQISLRGVGTTTVNPGIDQSVSLNVDNLQLTQGLAFKSAFFDMAQIEVLKGPQALFFGKSSPGGVISIRSADPTDQLEVTARAGYEIEADEAQAELIVSGPIGETVKARIAGQYSDGKSFFRNEAVGDPMFGGVTPRFRRSQEKGYLLRGTVLWEPTSDFQARLKINRTYERADNPIVGQLGLCPEGAGAPLGVPILNPADDCRVDRTAYIVDLDPAAFNVPNGGRTFLKTLQNYGTLELNYDISSGLSATSVTGYYDVKSSSLFNSLNSGSAAPAFGYYTDFRRHDFTQELRLNSDWSGGFNFTLGGFVQRSKVSNEVDISGNATLGLPEFLLRGVNTMRIRTNSIFGQVRFQVTPHLELAAGARYTDERRTLDAVSTITGTPVPVIPATPMIRAKNTSPEFTVNYRPNEDLTIFGAYKQGYKSGSFDIVAPTSPGEEKAFGDEEVRGGEIGVKARLFDRQATFNIAGYRYSYSGLQVGAIPPDAVVPTLRTINAGSAKVYGIEAEFNYAPRSIDGLRLNLAVNWNDAKFVTLNNIPCFGGQTIAQGCNARFNPMVNGGAGGFTTQDRSGSPLTRAPKWQVNFGFDYETSIGERLKLIFASNNQYSSRYLTNFSQTYYQEKFIKADAAITVKDSNDRWEVALIGKNLTNQITTGFCNNSNIAGLLDPSTQSTGTSSGAGIAGIDEVTCYADRGRSVWLRLTLRPFGG
jgi:iron complex outermembrane recepter protein